MGFTNWIVPIIVCSVFIFGVFKKVDIFNTFIEGAKEGMKTCKDILPALIILMLCISMFKASGAVDALTDFLAPATRLVGFPEECTPLLLLRPVSGSGSIAIFEQILNETGPDSFAGRTASVMLGSTETTFYTIAVYYSAVKIKRTRHTVAASLTGDLVGCLISGLVVMAVLGS